MTPRPRNLGETYTLIGRSIRDLEALGVTVPVALLQAYHSLAEHNLRVIAASKARLAAARKMHVIDGGKLKPRKPLSIVFGGFVLWSSACHIAQAQPPATMAPATMVPRAVLSSSECKELLR
jgi:hypothetical protein